MRPLLYSVWFENILDSLKNSKLKKKRKKNQCSIFFIQDLQPGIGVLLIFFLFFFYLFFLITSIIQQMRWQFIVSWKNVVGVIDGFEALTRVDSNDLTYYMCLS